MAGLYCIFGVHLAEIGVDWAPSRRGACNQWIRLALLFSVMGVDSYM